MESGGTYKMRTVIGAAAVLLLLAGCAANIATTMSANATEAQQCERGGARWRANLGFCEWQGTGTGKQ